MRALLPVCLICLTAALGCTAQQILSCPVTLPTECYFTGAATRAHSMSNPNSYFVIGGLFDIHERGDTAYTCGTTMSAMSMINLLAFFWGIDYYTDRYINSAVSVGAVAFDSCSRPDQTIENILGYAQCKLHIQQMQRENLVAYIGPYGNDDAERTGMLAKDLGVTLISPQTNSMNVNFEDQTTLLRLRPSFLYDIQAMVEFLKKVNSMYAIVLYSGDDPFWNGAHTALSQLLETDSICMQLDQNMVNVQTEAQMQNFVASQLEARQNARYIIPLMSREKVDLLMMAINGNNRVSDKFIFILNSNIGADLGMLSSKGFTSNNTIVIDQEIPGFQNDVMDRFKTYLKDSSQLAIEDVDNPWIAEYLANNVLPDLNETATATPLLLGAARTLMGVEQVIVGMHNAMTDCDQQPGNNYQFCDRLRNEVDKGNILYETIRDSKAIFGTTTGQLSSNQVRYVYRHYVNNNQGPQFHTVGTYQANAQGVFVATIVDLSDQSLYGFAYSIPGCTLGNRCCMDPPTTPTATTTPAVQTDPVTESSTPSPYSQVFYPKGQAITGAYATRERGSDEYGTRFDQGHRWVLALGVLAGLGILCVLVFEIYILYKLLGTHMGNKWRTMWLGQLLLFGIFLCYLVLFAYIFVPTDATCGITRFGVGVSYAICFAVLLVKLMVILTSKTSDVLIPGDESPNYLKGIYQFLMFIFAVSVQVVIDIQWLITVPPEAVSVVSNEGERVWICNHYTWEAGKNVDVMSDFVRTNFENHVMSLIYIMIMILITTILSLNAHGIITNHRESVFIGIASGFSIPIWLAWGLVGGLNRDRDYAHEFGDACIAFGLLLTATLILFAMFLPKVRQLVNMGVEGIYLEDDRDTYYAGSVIMAPPSYKSKGPSSVIYVNNQGIYSEPVVIGNGDPTATHLKHPGSTYSAPPNYLKKAESAYGSTRVLRVTDDLKGRHPQKRPQSEVAYGPSGRPRSLKGTLPRSRSHTDLGAL